MKNIIYVLACMALLWGCDSTIAPNGNVKIRIENTSAFDMDSVMVAYPEEEIFYGNISSGENSEYGTVSKAYRYAYIETKIEGKLSVLQPIDYVGEKFLDPGSYTYQLSVHDEYENPEGTEPAYDLMLELKKDS